MHDELVIEKIVRQRAIEGESDVFHLRQVCYLTFYSFPNEMSLFLSSRSHRWRNAVSLGFRAALQLVNVYHAV